MTTVQRLTRWRETGEITDTQFNAIAALVRKERFSVFLELNVLLYLGVASFIAGIGWVIQVYVNTLSDLAIISALTSVLLASFYYCFSRGLAFSPAQIESSNIAFDYILYLGCLTFGIEIGYVESQYHLMQSQWDYYLLASAVLFFFLAYRFDNRFVLSLGLSTLAGWFGLRTSRLSLLSSTSLREAAFVYGALVIASGTWLYRRNIKTHFTDTYFHIAAAVLFSAMLSGVFEDESSPYLLGLLFLSAAAIAGGIRFGRFAFVVYGIVFGYAGVSLELIRNARMEATAVLAYFVASAVAVILAIVMLARRFGRDE